MRAKRIIVTQREAYDGAYTSRRVDEKAANRPRTDRLSRRTGREFATIAGAPLTSYHIAYNIYVNIYPPFSILI